MTERGHQDHMLVLNGVKDLTLPSRKAVLYNAHGSGSLFPSYGQPIRLRTFSHGDKLGMGDGTQSVGW